METTTIYAALAAIGLPVLRSVGGWATNAIKDNVISKFELTKLAETMLRTSIIGTMVYFGVGNLGVEVTAIGSAASAILIDMILSAIKEWV